MAESVRAYHQRRLLALQEDRSPWDEIYEELDHYVSPGYVRMHTTSTRHRDEGNLRRFDVVDNRAHLAQQVFRSGMQSGMTSKARPWMKLDTFDERMRGDKEIRTYLDEATRRMLEIMDASNFYPTFHNKYGALGVIGTAASFISPTNDHHVARCTYLLAGQYWVANNAYGRVDTLYHEVRMTAQQIVQEFQMEGDRVPSVVQQAYDQGNRSMGFVVYHAMEPRTHRDSESMSPRHKPWLSNWWMNEDDTDMMMRESGSDINRVVVSRWDAMGDSLGADPYGYSPGHSVLPYSKQLNHAVQMKLEIIEKTSRPPMIATSAMKGNASIIPGAITYSDEASEAGGFQPAINLAGYRIGDLVNDIERTRQIIDMTFYNDLFRAITNMEGVQPRNQREIAERKEENLLQLGPALERVQAEELQQTIGILYHYMREAGRLPDLPDYDEEVEANMKVEYISLMAQAQKAVGVLSIERFTGFVAGLGQHAPAALNKLDTNEIVNEYAQRIGINAKLIRSNDEAKTMTDEQNRMAQQQQVAEMAARGGTAAKSAAEAVKTAGEAQGNRGELLDNLALNGETQSPTGV